MSKKTMQTRRLYYDICLPAYKYCLCQRLTSVWNGLWKMNNKQFIVGRSGSSEVLCIWISTILYFATVTAICGPRRWSISCKNQWSVSKYVTIIKNLGSWNTDGVICGKSVNRTSGCRWKYIIL